MLTTMSYMQQTGSCNDERLPKVGLLLGKAFPWPPRLMLNWVMPVSYSYKDLYNLGGEPRPILYLLMVQTKAQVSPFGVQVCLPGARVGLETYL